MDSLYKYYGWLPPIHVATHEVLHVALRATNKAKGRLDFEQYIGDQIDAMSPQFAGTGAAVADEVEEL